MDEKAGQCNEPYIVANVFDGGVPVRCVYDKGHAGAHGIIDRCAPGGKFEWVNSTDACAGEVAATKSVVEACRALARPTMAEQYRLFRVQMELAVKDITNGTGSVVCDHRDMWGAAYFLAFVTLPGLGTRTLEAYPDWDDYKKWARAAVDALVTEAGRAILRGGK